MSKITNKLLREAIADAEAVRETAIANAKLVLEQSITPQVKEMIARRLRAEAEMMDDEDEMDEAAEMTADTSAMGADMDTDVSADASDMTESDDDDDDDDDTESFDELDEAEFDLDSVIKELENDIAALDTDKSMDEGDEMDGDKELDLEEILAELHALDTDEGYDLEEGEMDDEKEIDLEELLSELEHEDEDDADDETVKSMHSEIVGLKTELAESRYAVNILRGHLKEVNLLNAKLLFTNKMFKKEGLTNDQKVRIVESFDRATTLREVKLVYTALAENFSTVGKTKTLSRKKIVTEGFASKATPSTAPKRESIVENTVARRLQELAGILN